MVAVKGQQSGYIALLAVLIVGAVALAISLALLISGTDIQRETLVQQQSAQAQALAGSCADEALQVVHDNTAYTGTGTLTLSTGSCSYTVTSTGSSTRTITTTGTAGPVVKKVQAYVTINATSISVTSWQEVS